MVGHGKFGSGCTLNYDSPIRKLQARIIVNQMGLPLSVLEDNLEEIYVAQLLKHLTNSSVTHLALLANEHPYNEIGERLPSSRGMYVPNELVLTLGERYPQLLPAVSIHPARKDALEELERCLDRGAALLKLLPNVQNVNCSLSAYAPFWKRMASAGLPLLAHTGGELALPEANKTYRDPKLLRLPLECGVTVIAAHGGTNSHYFDRDYTQDFLQMLQQYTNLYGDISGLMTPIRSRHFKHFLPQHVQARLVHGSDVPIPIQPLWLFLRGYLSIDDYLTLRKLKNPLERDIAAKRLMGFDETVFERFGKLVRWVRPVTQSQ